MGRPKGSKNKKTLEKERLAQATLGCTGCGSEGRLGHSDACQEATRVYPAAKQGSSAEVYESLSESEVA